MEQLNDIIKLYYFHTLKALWDGQGKFKMHYVMSRVKKQLLGKRSIVPCWCWGKEEFWIYSFQKNVHYSFIKKYLLRSTGISVSVSENILGEDKEISVETEFYILFFVIAIITLLGILCFSKVLPWLN